MLGTYITFPELLIWLPLLAGILCFFTGSESSRGTGHLRIATGAGSVHCNTFYTNNENTSCTIMSIIIKYIGNSFSIGLDGTGRLLTFLTALSFPMILIGSASNTVKQAPLFGLML